MTTTTHVKISITKLVSTRESEEEEDLIFSRTELKMRKIPVANTYRGGHLPDSFREHLSERFPQLESVATCGLYAVIHELRTKRSVQYLNTCV